MPLVGSLRQVTEGEWLRGLHSSEFQLLMTAHDPSVSVVLVNMNHCVDKIDPAKSRIARCSFSRRVFISAPHFPHGILHVCVSQGVDERVEHGGNHGVKQGKDLVVPDRISRGDIGEDEGQEEHEDYSDV